MGIESFSFSPKQEEIIKRRGIEKGDGVKAGEVMDDVVDSEKIVDIDISNGNIAGVDISNAYNIDIEVNNTGGNKREEVVNMSRRDFLKGAGAALVVLASGKVVEMMADREKKTDKLVELRNEEVEIDEEVVLNLEEMVKYKEWDRIDLTTIDLKEMLTKSWKKRYTEDSRLERSLKKAYYEMGEFDQYLKRIFKKVGVPEQFRYLAIPESHWNLHASSGAGAGGPYQLVAETARRWGLDVNNEVDDRTDPLLSCWASANELRQLYEKAKDWDLALTGYNGSKWFHGYLSKNYEKTRNQDGKLFHYQGFIQYMEDQINKKRDEIRDEKFLEYKIVEGDDINKIAKKYHKQVAEIKSVNRLKSDKVIKGRTLLIPSFKQDKERYFNLAMVEGGYFENLNYPAKFESVIELIKEGFVDKKNRQKPATIDMAAIERRLASLERRLASADVKSKIKKA